jgi:radical SAM superfamily enzyme YgiQ (UPF0313 family)
MNRPKVCLIYPRFKYISGDPPMGVTYLASYLKKHCPGIEVCIIDTTFANPLKHVFAYLGKNKPDILGVYADCTMVDRAVVIADWAGSRNIPVIFGGPQPTVDPEYFIAHADIVVRGEAELPLKEIVENWRDKKLQHISGIWWKDNGEIIKNPPNNNFLQLDDLLFPARDLLPMDRYIYNWSYLDTVDIGKRGTTMMVSRGCAFSCSYCQPTLRQMFGNRVRLRSPGNVVAEILALKERYGIGGIFFHDDTLTVDHHWLGEFCRRLLEEKMPVLWGCNSRVDTINENILKNMYAAGLRVIHFGIESGSQRILDEIFSKKITLDQSRSAVSLAKKIGIHAMGFFMLGAPTETAKEIAQTVSFACNLRLDEASFSLTTPLIGTDLHRTLVNPDKLKTQYRITPGHLDYYSRYALKGGLHPRRIKFFQLKAILFFYLHPFRFRYIIGHIFTPRGYKKLLNKIRRFF